MNLKYEIRFFFTELADLAIMLWQKLNCLFRGHIRTQTKLGLFAIYPESGVIVHYCSRCDYEFYSERPD